MHPFQLLTLLTLGTITLAIPSRRPPASHGRRGLAIEDAYVEYAKLFDSPWITWGYNRRPRAPVLPGAPHGSRAYVPMLADVSMLRDWNASASLALKEGATGLMS